MRVLVVEDSIIAQTLLKDMLGLKGHEVVAQVKTQAEAIEAYRTHKPDIVTMDVGLGKESGLTVLASLLAIDPNAKVVMITGNPQVGLREKSLAAGAFGFLTKPLKLQDLEAAILKPAVPPSQPEAA